MAFNGSGSFTLVAGNPVVTGTTISSTWANNTLSDIANGLSTTITKDGQTTPTANIPMGGFKLTGLAAATTNGDALRYQDKIALEAEDTAIKAGIQTQLYTAFTTGGTTTAYTLTPSPAITSLVANQRFRVKFNAANTSTTPTLAVNGLAATALKVYDSVGAKQNPAVGALALNMLTDVEYDGTDYVVLDRLPPSMPFSESYTSAATTFALGTPITFTHGLGGQPTLVQIWLRNKIAAGGYTVGQDMPYNNHSYESGSAARGFAMNPKAATIDVCPSSNIFQGSAINNGTTFVINASDWDLIVKAWR